jgi:hypothetical protein
LECEIPRSIFDYQVKSLFERRDNDPNSNENEINDETGRPNAIANNVKDNISGDCRYLLKHHNFLMRAMVKNATVMGVSQLNSNDYTNELCVGAIKIIEKSDNEGELNYDTSKLK